MTEPPPARLRAIVAVDPSKAVRCQQPGCGRRVYAAVHVVEDAGQLLVLGSDCYSKRYGGGKALGGAYYGSSSGRTLTNEERQLLIDNTAALLAHFAEQDRLQAEALARAADQRREQQRQFDDAVRARQEQLAREQVAYAAPMRQLAPARNPQPVASPWTWQCQRNTSVAVLTSASGTAWVRVQHREGSQKLIPWPELVGWETLLPPSVGQPDFEVRGYTVRDVVYALQYLQTHGFSRPEVGRWRDVQPRRKL